MIYSFSRDIEQQPMYFSQWLLDSTSIFVSQLIEKIRNSFTRIISCTKLICLENNNSTSIFFYSLYFKNIRFLANNFVCHQHTSIQLQYLVAQIFTEWQNVSSCLSILLLRFEEYWSDQILSSILSQWLQYLLISGILFFYQIWWHRRYDPLRRQSIQIFFLLNIIKKNY